MSDPYDIVCYYCQEKLLVGDARKSFYSSDPVLMENLRRFLFKHEWYTLRFLRFDLDRILNYATFVPSENEDDALYR